MNLVNLKRISFVISTISLCCAMASCKKEEKPMPSWAMALSYEKKCPFADVPISVSFGFNPVSDLSKYSSFVREPIPDYKLTIETFNNENITNNYVLYIDEGITNIYAYETTPSGKKLFSFQQNFIIPKELFSRSASTITIVAHIFIKEEIYNSYAKCLNYKIVGDNISFVSEY